MRVWGLVAIYALGVLMGLVVGHHRGRDLAPPASGTVVTVREPYPATPTKVVGIYVPREKGAREYVAKVEVGRGKFADVPIDRQLVAALIRQARQGAVLLCNCVPPWECGDECKCGCKAEKAAPPPPVKVDLAAPPDCCKEKP
jgi:hypothetical protein